VDIFEQIPELEREAAAALEAATDAKGIEDARLKFLSRKGAVPALMERLKEVPGEKKREVGQRLNELKGRVQSFFDAAKERVESAAEEGGIDATLPGRPIPDGHLHLITQVTDRIVGIFRRLGFSIAEGPDVETEWHNFDALNTPPDHPARNEQDTFYLDRPADPKYGRFLLRTQTSPVQIRVMQSQQPPVRVICPGRCYRRDEIDATHSSSFHQVEGLSVDRGVSLADLKGTLEFFFRELLGPGTRMRFRPHFFPFTEPSFEVDLSSESLGRTGKDWLEIAGCGMVDPAVFQAVGYDPETYTGYAFGLGVERIVMILHGIPDIRLFEQNDLRFLRQF
jgi:phenylalanyl-tRNA synthetase alpha chain